MGVALRSAAAGLGVPIRIDVAVGAAYPPQVGGLAYACCLDILERVETGTSVTVTIRHDEDAVTFEILAACALDEATAERDRVEALGGRLTFQRSDHQTRVTGTLPLSR